MQGEHNCSVNRNISHLQHYPPRLEDEYFTEPLYILIDCENQK